MREYLKTKLVVGATMVAVLLTGCHANGDDAILKNSEGIESNDLKSIGKGIYNGEWTVNQQMMGTERLVVGDELKVLLPDDWLNEYLSVMLPQDYLINLCFPDLDTTVDFANMSSRFYLQQLGYSDKAVFLAFTPSVNKVESGEQFYNNATFDVELGGKYYMVVLLSPQKGNAVYRTDSQQWTIGLPISSYVIIDGDTREKTERRLDAPVTLYYNTTERIR